MSAAVARQAAAPQPQDLVVRRGELVGGGVALGGHPPLVQQLLAVVDAGDGLRVPNVDRQEHGVAVPPARAPRP